MKPTNKSMDPPDNSDGLLSWDSCLACDSGNEDDCICPACNIGDSDNCFCCNGLTNNPALNYNNDSNTVSPAEGDIGPGNEYDGMALIKALPNLRKINESMQSIITLFKSVVFIEKGWLGDTSQSSLDDGDFLWISTDGKTRKLPIAIHGKVSVDGWLAAWGVLHGGMGGAKFAGGPSKSAVMAKLMSRKPSGITIKDGHASRTSTKKAEEEIIVTLPGFISIDKAAVDIKLGIIFGKASVANIPDRQGDVISETELEKAAYNFMANANKRATNTHKEDIPGKFVASYVSGAEWIVGFKPDDIEIAKAASRGEFVGWSIGGMARQVPIALNRGAGSF